MFNLTNDDDFSASSLPLRVRSSTAGCEWPENLVPALEGPLSGPLSGALKGAEGAISEAWMYWAPMDMGSLLTRRTSPGKGG